MRNGTSEHRAVDVRFGRGQIIVDLTDGRQVRAPLSLYPTLEAATEQQRANWRPVGRGVGLHWPDMDLDLETEQIVLGEREAFPPPPPLTREKTA